MRLKIFWRGEERAVAPKEKVSPVQRVFRNLDGLNFHYYSKGIGAYKFSEHLRVGAESAGSSAGSPRALRTFAEVPLRGGSLSENDKKSHLVAGG